VAWTLFVVETAKRSDLDAVLKDDTISRQSQKLRDAASAGGKAGELYVLVEGSDDAVKRADELLAKVGKKLPAAEANPLYRKFKDEEEAASTGMGLFFTE
jgi:hypothetical protein